MVRVLASSKPTSDKSNATTDEGSLQLPHQTSMPPCSVVQPNPCTNGHDQQKDQASVLHWLKQVLPILGGMDLGGIY